MCVKCCLPGKLTRDLVPRVFTGGRLPRHPLPAMYQIPDSQEEGRCAAWKPRLFAQTVQAQSHSYHWGNGGSPPQIQVPRHQLKRRPCQQAFLKTQPQACYVNSFLPRKSSAILCFSLWQHIAVTDARLNLYNWVLTNLLHLYYWVLMNLALTK